MWSERALSRVVRAVRVLPALVVAFGGLPVLPVAAQKPTLLGETPAKFTPATSSFDYQRRDTHSWK